MLARRSSYVFTFLRARTQFNCEVAHSTENCKPLRTSICEQLVSTYGNKARIKKLFKSNPDFHSSEIYFWDNFLCSMKSFGFSVSECLNLLGAYPPLLVLGPNKVMEIMKEWQKCTRLTLEELKRLLLRRPYFISVDQTTIKRRIPFLLSFSTSNDALVKLLILCPNLLIDRWDEIKEKITFLNDVMVVHRTEVLNCRALSKPLEHIQIRFSILHKCGRYIKPNPHEHKQTKTERLQLGNPTLRQITETNDSSFAKKIARITIEEYEVYRELFFIENFPKDEMNFDDEAPEGSEFDDD